MVSMVCFAIVAHTIDDLRVFEDKMSTSNRSTSKRSNRESSCNIFTHFPDVVNDRIDTKTFLNASRGVVKLIEKFGKLFAPVKYDMQGNIEKVNAGYLLDKEINSTLQDMILLEVAVGDRNIATNALLWLTRDLHMIHSFFEKIVQDCQAEKGTEDLVAILKKSYEESLEPYHGWMAKQLFGLLSRMVPSRSYVLQILANEITPREDAIVQVMSDFTRSLRTNVETLHCFYEEYGLENNRS
ncbi:pleckstrin homology domain-containing family A member 8 [Venturia canescens]|uniref:pleckstrin homology domain-containing family A member 8 n=1 Tax=Venturia canescens TaxID=32260 RepID=UPI001C9CC31B|nr:pleckstrin homology domain-containing family A member 8 [Venturia canescens]